MRAPRRRLLMMLMMLVALLALAVAFPAVAARAEAPANETKLWSDSDPLPAPGAWVCVATNPNCAAHEPWWREANAAPTPAGALARFSPLGPGFTADARLVEAVFWVSLWPDGRALLRTAAAQGVSVRVAPIGVATHTTAVAAADYDPRTRTITVSPRFLRAPSWILGDVLVHELTHVSQAATGMRFGPNQCLAEELPARQTETAYTRFVAQHMGGLISDDQLKTLPPEGQTLFNGIVALLYAQDLREYVRSLCAATGGA